MRIFEELGLNKKEWTAQLLFIIILLTSFAVLRPTTWWGWVLLYTILSIPRDLLLQRVNGRRTLKQAVLVALLYFVIKWLGGYGLLGYLLLILFFAAAKIISQKKLYIKGVETIEKQIWGSTANERREQKRTRRSNGRSEQ